ncbi:MAG: aminopeptidase [Candidatus Margulisiibacteriota bacterium]|nr:aminopeptidase [Candidatus Margulisiibacteriota bacterium]
MKKIFIERYATLLTGYCCNIKKGQKILIRSTYLAEELVLECQKQVLLKGATCEFEIGLPNSSRQKYDYSTDAALSIIPTLYSHAIDTFDAIISIHAPFDLFELKGVSEDRLAIQQSALKPVKTQMMSRSKNGELKWVICNFPTQALAESAQMNLDDYTTFIIDACFLNNDAPLKEWQALSKTQQHYVNRLDKAKKIYFKSDHVDISFLIDDRTWVNSDGQRNMPSGEVFTSPQEDSGEGTITFTHPSLLFGEVIKDLTLTIKNGVIVNWEARHGKQLLDRLFEIDGANKIGEIAIGTNYSIKKPTLNTLFDEKIGGTIHMAVGASYPETGGKNQSSIHHDFVTEFSKNSTILIDDECVYENGHWII